MTFVADFVNYVKTRTDAPPDFHVHAALACLSAALGNRVHADGWGRPIYPHLWIVLIAPSGYGKSVPLDMAQRMLQKAGLGDCILPTSFSQEALITLVSNQPAGIFFHQEFARFIEVLGRDYNSGLMQALTEWFDTPEQDKRILMKETVTIERPALTILGASSPDWFAEKYNQSMLRGGFFARFIFCPSNSVGEYVADPGPFDDATEAVLAYHLQEVSKLAGKADFRAVKAKLSDWEYEYRTAARKDCPPDFAGMRSRASLMVKKAAMLFHVAHDPQTLSIQASDLDKAIKYIERAHKMAEAYLSENVPRTKEEADTLKVIEALTRHDGALQRSDTLKVTHLSAFQLDRAVRTLTESGRILAEKMLTTGGRYAWVYRLPPAANGHAESSQLPSEFAANLRSQEMRS